MREGERHDMSEVLQKRKSEREAQQEREKLRNFICPHCQKPYRANQESQCIKCKLKTIFKRVGWIEKQCKQCNKPFIAQHQTEICSQCDPSPPEIRFDGTSQEIVSHRVQPINSHRISDNLSADLNGTARNSPFVLRRKIPEATFICKGCKKRSAQVTNLDLVHGGLCPTCYNKRGEHGSK